MSGNEELKKIKEKIRSLLNMTTGRGASENEANKAMETVGKLLLQYNLSMETLDIAGENCVKVVLGTGTKKRSLHSQYTVSLADFCDVKVWSSKTDKEMTFVFFGLEPDVQMAEYLFKMISATIKFETNAYKKTPAYINAEIHRKRLSNSFQNGMARRIHYRLRTLADQKETTERSISSSRDLIILAKDQKIEEEFKKIGIKLRNQPNVYRITDHRSAIAGAAAGDRVNFNRPVEGNGPLLIKN